MEFRVLGPLEVIDDAGRALPLGGSRPRTVLAALLLDAGRTVSVDSLVDALWGDAPPATAANALQVHVGALRKVLDPDRVGDRLVTRPPGYSLCIGAGELDAQRFEQLVRDGRQTLAQGELSQGRALLARALALWRGVVLADLRDEPFVRDEAERLEEMRLAATEDRIAVELGLGTLEGLVPELEVLVTAHPLRERLSGLLMLALYQSDRQADALAVYRRLREHLVEELGIDPNLELRELEQRILVQDEALLGRTPDTSTVSTRQHVPEPVPMPPALARPLPALVGRQAELAAIDRALEDRLPCAPTILISGEPGAGKSHLMAASAARAATAGYVVLHGRCHEEPIGAVAPLVDALEPVVRLAATAGLLDGPIRGRPQLRRVFRDIPDGAGGEPATTDPEEDQARLLAGMLDIFEAVTRDRPTVLFLDDLHWADQTTLRAVSQLATRLDRMPLLVVGAYRDTDLSNGALPATIERLRRSTGVTLLPLAGLGPDDASELLRSLVTDLHPTVLVDLCGRAQGNPLFLVELARAVEADTGAAGSLPEGVRDIVRERLGRLAPTTAELLATAAVCGPAADLATLQAVTGLEEEALIDAIEEATAAHLLADVPGDPDRLAFTHALVRDTLYGGLSTLRRRRLHRLVADHLEHRPAGDPRSVIEAARHLLASDPGGDLPRVIGRVIEAAQLSLDDLAFEQACQFYEQVLDLLEQGARPSRTRSFEVYVGLARAQRATGLHDAARETCLRAVSAARELGDDVSFGEAVLQYVWFHPATPFVIRSTTKASEETKEVLDLLEEAVEVLPDGPPSLVGALLAHWSLLTGDDTEKTLALAGRAVELADLGDFPAVQALALHADLSAHYDPALRPEEIRACAERIEALALRGGDLDRRATALALQIQGALEAGADDVDALVARYGDLARSSHVPLHSAYKASLDAMRALMFGALADVERHAAIAVERSGNDENFVLGWAMQVVNARRQHGGVDEVVGPMRAFAGRFANNPAWLAALALVDVETGELAAARAGLVEAARGFRTQERDSFWLVTAALAAEGAWLVGDPAIGAEMAAVLAPFSDRSLVVGPSVVYLGSIDRYRGLGHLAAGQVPDARAALDVAVATHRSMGAEPLLALSLFERAAVSEGGPDPAPLEEAAAIADRLGLVPLQGRIERLRSAG